MASTSKTFEPGDLIWAKMKGFPPWPAKVLSTDASSDMPSGMPNGRVSVMFFGTRETAFMKPTDLFAYLENRHQFEVPRKHKGFNEGVNEIRLVAGLNADELFKGEVEGAPPARSASPPPPRTHRSSNNSKLIADVFISGFDRKRNQSISSFKARSRTSSSASLMKSLVRNMKKRTRVESESSNGSRKRRRQMSEAEEQRLVLDAFDHLNPLEGLEGGILEQEEDNRSKRSRESSRGESSRVFEEYMLAAGRTRTRSGGSDGARSRLISGVSDVFNELFDQGNSFSAEALMLALDELPSEGSSGAGGERARTPEAPTAILSNPVKFCSDCGCECQLYGIKWRCTSKFCLKWNGTHDPFGPSTSKGGEVRERKKVSVRPDPPPVPNPPAPLRGKKENESTPPVEPTPPPSDASPGGRIKRKTVRISPPPPTLRSPQRKLGYGTRPQKYKVVSSKVEKTPPISENGLRKCSFCGGQVRPQMCGGTKHRWRCVDKRCRKWYGWVKMHEEFPRDLPTPALQNRPSKASTTHFFPPVMPRKVGRPPKHHGLKIKLGTKKEIEANRPKRKYTKRKDKEAAAAAAGVILPPPKSGVRAIRALSPLTEDEATFRPSAMERRGRWWTSEKRRTDYSPPRPFTSSVLDTSAACYLVANACSAAAATRSDEPGTISGTIDLLMDSIISTIGPLLTIFNTLPRLAPDKDVSQVLWTASSVHTPMFHQ